MLTNLQRARIRKSAKLYSIFLQSEKAKSDLQDLSDNSRLMIKLVAPEQLEKMSAGEQWEKIKKVVLHVAKWTSEDMAIKQFNENYDPADAIRKLRFLVEGKPSVEYQFDRFHRVWGSGSAETSIVLLLVYPEKYGMWTIPSKKGLEKLGFIHKLPVDKKGDISGTIYREFNKVLVDIQQELKENGINHSLMELRVLLDFSGRSTNY